MHPLGAKSRVFLLALSTGVRFMSLSQLLITLILIILINAFLMTENSAVSLLLTSEAGIMIRLFICGVCVGGIMSACACDRNIDYGLLKV